MTKRRQIVLFIAIVLTGVSCERKPAPDTSGTDAAKLRPEVAVAKQSVSPTPFPHATVSSTPAP